MKYKNRIIDIEQKKTKNLVLLILAGVSIATLTGKNGILTRANEAKVKTEEAAKEEEINL